MTCDADQIEVVIHPQSIVHSLVEFVDGSVVAQLGPPDMRLPIQYALTYPRRAERGSPPRLDWPECMRLEFEPPDLERFPALELGLEAARAGGTTGAVLNAANEAAVAGFSPGELRFTEIVPPAAALLEHHDFDPNPSLDELVRAGPLGHARRSHVGSVSLIAAFDAWSWLTCWVLIVEVARRPGHGDFRPRAGALPRRQGCGVKCEKFYLGFDIYGLKLASSNGARPSTASASCRWAAT